MKSGLFMIIAILGLGLVLVGSAFAKGGSAQEFVRKASIANQFELESSKIAVDKAKSEDVKSFAQRMVDDHTKVAEQLQEAAKSANISPTKTLDSEHQKMIDELNSMRNGNFDNRYMSMQMKAHEKSIQVFSSYADSGSDPELKSFASQMLPTLKEHLKEVQRIKGGL